ncbi:hypothetical protein BDN70DRAFT_934152 [Pholiota conissans]|uniref:Uncharacterized protein n=1 Tax=Pholiota conissans TaxID=109636 RepID=A0A9P5YYQ1_9AGAR|nr:hypothetical protein BDN70DRAFT_934152 [Pholiota conissans]
MRHRDATLGKPRCVCVRTRLCLAPPARGHQKLAASGFPVSSQVRYKDLSICTTSTTPNNSSQSKLANGLRGSLRNLTWKTSQTSELGRRVFQRKRLFTKEPTIKEDWSEEFHLITREDIDPDSPPVPSLRVRDNRDVLAPTFGTRSDLQKGPSPPSYKLLPPLITADSQINRVSTHTTRTINTSDSVTPTSTEFAHITAIFPQPPSYIPPSFSTPIEPNFTPLNSSRPVPTINYRRDSPSIVSPISEANPTSLNSLKRIRIRAKDILRFPSLLSSWKQKI